MINKNKNIFKNVDESSQKITRINIFYVEGLMKFLKPTYSKYVIQIELATPLYGIMVNLTT